MIEPQHYRFYHSQEVKSCSLYFSVTNIVGFTNIYASGESRTRTPNATVYDWAVMSSGISTQTIYINNATETSYYVGIFPADDWIRGNSILLDIVALQSCHNYGNYNGSMKNYTDFVELENGAPVTMIVDNDEQDFYQFSVSKANVQVVFSVLVWYGDVNVYISKENQDTSTGYPNGAEWDWKEVNNDDFTCARIIKISRDDEKICGASDDDSLPCTYRIVSFDMFMTD